MVQPLAANKEWFELNIVRGWVVRDMKRGNRYKLSNRKRNRSLGNDGAKPKLRTISIPRLPGAHEEAEEGQECTEHR